MMENQRDYLFDNLKTVLIFLVVVGHIYGEYMGGVLFFKSIYIFIYMFHMPLFIFVSGYFSKNIERTSRNATKLIIPYLVFNTIWYAILIAQGNQFSIKSLLFVPYGLMWYIFALLIWRMGLKYLIKVKYIVIISIICGLLIGILPKYNDIFSISRVIAFLPFYLIGYYCTKENIDKIKRFPKIISFVGLLSIIMFAILLGTKGFMYQNLFMNVPYSANGSIVKGLVIRLFGYIFAILSSIFVINIVSTKANKLTNIGQNTMVIYLGHTFIRLMLVTFIPTWNMTALNNIIILIIPILITLVLSNKNLTKIYEYIFERKIKSQKVVNSQ